MGMTDYLAQANEGTLVFAMIETRTAIANLDAILATPGIDGVFVGPSDLSITLSNGASLDPNGKAVDDVSEKIAAAAKKAGKIAGAYTGSADRANEQAARGFRLLAVSSDGGFLQAGAAAALKGLKK
jgi:4-hydroxy-2-oxoheptanedioate aldolase